MPGVGGGEGGQRGESWEGLWVRVTSGMRSEELAQLRVKAVKALQAEQGT